MSTSSVSAKVVSRPSTKVASKPRGASVKTVMAPMRGVPASKVKAQASVTIVKGGAKLKPLSLSYGSDPELMVVDTHQGGKIVSAITVLNGATKDNPVDLGDGIKAYADGVLLEAALPPVTAESGRIVTHLKDVFTRIQAHLGDRYRLLPQASHIYDDSELLKADGSKIEAAWEIGCTPWIDVYASQVVVPDPFTDGMRSSSSHCHWGRTDFQDAPDQRLLSIDSKEEATKLMDAVIGCSHVLLSTDATALRRRLKYGKAGTMRMQSYGGEYRPLESHAFSSPLMAQLIWDLMAHALSFIDQGTGADLLKLVSAADVQTAINTCDKVLARKVVDQIQLPADLMRRVTRVTYKDVPFAKAWSLV